MKETDNRIIMFKTEDEKISVDVRFDEETVWLSLEQIALLFERDKSTISRHIKNVFDEGELIESATVANFATVQTEGTRQIERKMDYYNLDMIISVGYRVKSLRGTQFRQWATKRLNEYIRKGFTLDDERLKNGGGRYFRELLQRIRDIRSSERNLFSRLRIFMLQQLIIIQKRISPESFLRLYKTKCIMLRISIRLQRLSMIEWITRSYDGYD